MSTTTSLLANDSDDSSGNGSDAVDIDDDSNTLTANDGDDASDDGSNAVGIDKTNKQYKLVFCYNIW